VKRDIVIDHFVTVWATEGVTEKGMIVGALLYLAASMIVWVALRFVLRPLGRAWRARRGDLDLAALDAAKDAPGPPGAVVVPRFGTPVPVLYDSSVHGDDLRCASGVKCGHRRFAPSEAFFQIAAPTEHHPMVAVCHRDVVLRDGALAGQEWTDAPAVEHHGWGPPLPVPGDESPSVRS
jgi:hypothetical protein